MHRDSLGTEIEIQPGAVNWMTAGKGIVHSERTPDVVRGKDKSLHGLHIWVALPKHLESMQPAFMNVAAKDIPSWKKDGVNYKLIAGEVFGRKFPVHVYRSLFMIEIKTDVPKTINIGDGLFGESAMYILEGSVMSEANTFDSKHILVSKDSKLCSFEMGAHTTIYIFGGEPLSEECFIYWNLLLVKNTLLNKLKADWLAQRFGQVSNETEFVPLPEF